MEVRDRLAVWEASSRLGDLAAAYHRGQLDRYLEGLRALIERERSREQAALLGTLALGPRDRGLPGAGEIGPLVDLAMASPADVLDLVIAWGAGWGRPLWPAPDWRARWVGAALVLALLVRRSINRTVAWLAENVLDVRRGLHAGGDQERAERLEGWANHITMELVHGRCQCGHSRGGICSRPGHRLDAWRPDRCRLPAFVAMAVRGTAHLPVRAGAFSASMLATALGAEELLVVDSAEFSVCHECNARRIGLAARERRRIQLRELERGLYDVGCCGGCGQAPHPERTYRVSRKNWLLLPAAWGGRYHAVQRRRCMACGNLLALERAECPLCQWQVPRRGRLTTVWVRSR